MGIKTLIISKPALRKVYIGTVLGALILLVARYLTAFNEGIQLILMALLGLLVLHLIYVLVKTAFIMYSISDQYVELQEGIMARRTKRAPFMRITNYHAQRQTDVDHDNE